MSGTGGVAVVGLACRYPDADAPGELWETVLGRRRGFRRLPERRLSADYLGPADDPDRTYVTHAGLLRGWRFDRERFGVPGPLHRAADHAHWLALETAADALADAGFPDGGGLDRDRVGVVFGNTMTGEFSRAAQLRLRWPFVRRAAVAALAGAGVAADQAERALALFGDLVRAPFPTPGDETLAGALSNTIAGRVCNHFDFHGTGFTVDGACASSLLSVTAAARALLGGELDFALAGGVDLSLDPFELVGFARTGALAVDEMRVYDQRPTGFLPGEGCGVVALMRAEDAERQGVRTYAVLTGWGTSSDGAGGLTRPRAHGQGLAMDRAYRMAGVSPRAVELVEGHGTGTRVGDEVELTALRDVRGAGSPRAALGSVKANIGHTKAAAGVAGLIKAVLAVHHRVLPPTTGVESPHRLLRDPDVPLRLLDEAEPWSTRTPLASVSSMGFGGINAHVVLRGLPARPVTALPAHVAALGRPAPRHDVVLLDAADRTALDDRLAAVEALAPALSAAELHDLAATAHAERRGPGAVRCALVADTPDRLRHAATAARGLLPAWTGAVLVDEPAGVVLAAGPPRRVGLLLPGQAAPVRAELDPWAAGLDVPDAGVPVVDGATGTDVAQPAVVRHSLAALAWLEACGCHPVGAVGHSLGEITALAWAGALDHRTAQAVAVARGRVMADHGAPGTAMAGVAGDEEITRAVADGLDVEITGYNGPAQTTVGGPADAVAEFVARARRRGVRATGLPVSHAFHSTAMRDVVEPLRAVLAQVPFTPPVRPVFSTVTGHALPADVDLVGLLADQVTRPVRFTEALAGLAGRCDLLVEAGPGTTLTDLARAAGATAVAVDSGDPRRHALATATLAACSAGDLGAWFAGRAHRPLGPDTRIELLANPCEADLPDHAAPVPALPGPRPLTTDTDPLSVVRAQLSRVLELPLATVRPDSTLLGDLHLNSLQAVQVVGSIADLLGRRPPDGALSNVDTTVADVAELLAARPAAATADDRPPPGVAPWVRVFEHRWTPFPTPPAAPPGGTWEFDAPPDHWLRAVRGLPGAAGERNLAVWLADERPAAVARVLALVGARRPRRLVVAHRGHPAAAAIGRGAAVELDGCAVTVVDGDTLDPALVAATGYRELRVRPGGVAQVTTHARRPVPGGGIPLGPGDVCLVTGGASGITAECGAALAARTGCVLVVVGRSAPDAPHVVAALHALRERADVRYARADVTDPAQVTAAVAAAARVGPVRGLLHGAGVNRPRLLGAVTAETLHATLEPKVTGLRLLLAATPDLRLAVAFGSIIGRRGLPGQAEYGVANDWLRAELDRAERPGLRRHLVEWSLWDGVGMGERMGVVAGLAAAGITPITPQDGPPALLDVLADRDAPVTVLITGRFPEGPTLAIAGPPPEPLRFTEDLRVRFAGVEAVADAELSLGHDPYLGEHRVAGVPVLPAVLGLEAMAQAVVAAVGRRRAWAFADVDLRSPVTVPDRGVRTVRSAALAEGADAVRVVLRDDADGFATDRFTAVVRAAAEPGSGGPPDEAAVERPADTHAFYGPLLFHRGRFRRLLGYDRLSAFEVRARVRAEPGTPWFSEFHHRRLLLGDPGAHDAALHVLLACVPHRRALPVGADRFTVWRPPEGVLRVHAVETTHTADDYVFDVDVLDASGAPVARWDALRLRAIGPARWAEALPASLVGPLLSRRLVELDVAPRVDLVVAGPDGAAGHTLHAAADHPVGAVWGATAALEPFAATDADTAAVAARKLDEPIEVAAGRVTAGRAALGRAGLDRRVPLEVAEVTDDGLLVLRGAGTAVVVARPSVAGVGEPVVAIAVEVG